MKVDNLLGPYLYQFKELSLPGIGTFTLDDKAVLPDDSAKVKLPIEGITFSGKSTQQLSDQLVQYIKDNTGKMKPLAEADLYSFITTALQFLNIGKPYYFEGIGTLQKNKEGNYHFTAGTVLSQRTDEPLVKFGDSSNAPAADREPARGGGQSNNQSRMLVLLGLLITLGLVAWGGYYLYKKNAGETEQETKLPTAAPAADTTATNTNQPVIDSSGKRPAVTVPPTDSTPVSSTAAPATKPDSVANAYKFILETTEKKARALKRYTQLKDVTILPKYNDKVLLETKDSTLFNIYTIVNCLPADTGKVKELLNAWYYGANAANKVQLQH